jgi:hypothetical protein
MNKTYNKIPEDFYWRYIIYEIQQFIKGYVKFEQKSSYAKNDYL